MRYAVHTAVLDDEAALKIERQMGLSDREDRGAATLAAVHR